jgi:hypothetical protein
MDSRLSAVGCRLSVWYRTRPNSPELPELPELPGN